jgi:hypothetical protein
MIDRNRGGREQHRFAVRWTLLDNEEVDFTYSDRPLHSAKRTRLGPPETVGHSCQAASWKRMPRV